MRCRPYAYLLVVFSSLFGVLFLGAGCGRSTLNDDPEATVADAGTEDAPIDAPPDPVCAAAGAPCLASADCCNFQCVNNVCLVAMCQPDGAPCQSAAGCCSQLCGPNGICGESQCVPDGLKCSSNGQCCGGTCNNGVCGKKPSCHDLCSFGDPIDSQCGACAALICQTDSYCCLTGWDDLCIGEVSSVCNDPKCSPVCSPLGSKCLSDDACCSNFCTNGVCGGPQCTPDGGACSSPVQCCSGFCNGGVCATQCTPDGFACKDDEQCCTGLCFNNVCGGSQCTPDGGACSFGFECCGGFCDNGTCGIPTGPCSHNLCIEGQALPPGCDACVTKICSVDPFCCQVQWDSICVAEVGQVCGSPQCSTCTPDGGACMANGQCCTGTCNNGICGKPTCTPDGGACMGNGQCCNGQCTNGTCGPQPVCPSDGTPCGDCLATNCCSQISACFNTPACTQNIGCFIACVGNGGNPFQCGIQCVSNPQAIQVLLCLANQCGPGTCF